MHGYLLPIAAASTSSYGAYGTGLAWTQHVSQGRAGADTLEARAGALGAALRGEVLFPFPSLLTCIYGSDLRLL